MLVYSVLRALAEGRVAWGFWPPGTEKPSEGLGIWIPGTEAAGTDGELTEPDDEPEEPEQSEEGEEEEDSEEEGEEDDEEDEDEEDDDGIEQRVGGGRFGALAIDGGEESEESE